MHQTLLRTILVTGDSPALFIRLRDEVRPDLAQVLFANPKEVSDLWSEFRPFPWMLVGNIPNPPKELVADLYRWPVLVTWLGECELKLPSQAHTITSWRDILVDLNRIEKVNLNGLSLAPKRGVRLPDGQYLVGAPELEGAMGAYPEKLEMENNARRIKRVNARLKQNGVTWSLQQADGLLWFCPPEGLRK